MNRYHRAVATARVVTRRASRLGSNDTSASAVAHRPAEADEALRSCPVNAIQPITGELDPVVGPVRVTAVLCGPCDDAAAWQLPADPLSVPQARALCRQAARAWAVPAAVAQDAEIVVCEFVTNAVVHGRPPIFLQFGRVGGELVAAVYDAGDTMPVLNDPTWCDPGRDVMGRGLALVIPAYADCWTVTRCSPGKIVTARLTVDSAAEPDLGDWPSGAAAEPVAARAVHQPEDSW
ncbi:MAG TPA: ATP-binding protein [Streptosporangiaceae bacterium]